MVEAQPRHVRGCCTFKEDEEECYLRVAKQVSRGSPKDEKPCKGSMRQKSLGNFDLDVPNSCRDACHKVLGMLTEFCIPVT
ncbi:hypothetical protein TNCV_2140691 [Trichonephila clavipes]|uniref:Uncharacterized protein n=1 Tax=Trichonephila clavipes TaxID=2585209 RepID=A0A8X6RXD8_TRICX|nr:hypothetical protein TNCV_2140691 [Trichonephila clavipes]